LSFEAITNNGVRVSVVFPWDIKTCIMTNSGVAAAGQGPTDNGGGKILEPPGTSRISVINGTKLVGKRIRKKV
jgi:hypothetical protein